MSEVLEICDTCKCFSGERREGFRHAEYRHQPTGWCMKLRRIAGRDGSCGDWKPDCSYEYEQVAELERVGSYYY